MMTLNVMRTTQLEPTQETHLKDRVNLLNLSYMCALKSLKKNEADEGQGHTHTLLHPPTLVHTASVPKHREATQR